MMGELERAREKETSTEYLEEKPALDLLVMDDFGHMEPDLDKCRDLFEVIDGRCARTPGEPRGFFRKIKKDFPEEDRTKELTTWFPSGQEKSLYGKDEVEGSK